MTREFGKIKWYRRRDWGDDREYDFGSISREDKADLYVHQKQVQCSESELFEETVVTFEVGINPRNGKEEAQNLNLVTKETDLEVLGRCFQNDDPVFWHPLMNVYLNKLQPYGALVAVLQKLTKVNRTEQIRLINRLSLDVLVLPDAANLRAMLPAKRHIELLLLQRETGILDEQAWITEFTNTINQEPTINIRHEYLTLLPDILRSHPSVLPMLPNKEQIQILVGQLNFSDEQSSIIESIRSLLVQTNNTERRELSQLLPDAILANALIYSVVFPSLGPKDQLRLLVAQFDETGNVLPTLALIFRLLSEANKPDRWNLIDLLPDKILIYPQVFNMLELEAQERLITRQISDTSANLDLICSTIANETNFDEWHSLIRLIPDNVRLHPTIFPRLDREDQKRLLATLLGETDTQLSVFDRIASLLTSVNSKYGNNNQYLLETLPDKALMFPAIYMMLQPNMQIRLHLKQLNEPSEMVIAVTAIKDILAKQEIQKRPSLIELLPGPIRANPLLFDLLPPIEQVETIWDEHLQWFNIWPSLSQKTKILLVYRAVKDDVLLPVDQLNEMNPIVKYALLILWAKYHPNKALDVFHRAHKVLQDYVIEIAWLSESPLDVEALLPPCSPKVVDYCEGRKWDKIDKQTKEKSTTVFCPRLGGECTPWRGARIYPNLSLDWEDWSLLELLAAAHIQPDLPELHSPEEYVPKLSGWINRLNEIRSRLKCSKCGEIMRPNYAYAKNLARYNMTIVTCGKGEGHDKDIYLNHCWGCEAQIIDSRESPFRVHNYDAMLIDPEPVFSVERSYPTGSLSQPKFYKKAGDGKSLVEIKVGDPFAIQSKGYYLCLRCGSGPQDDGTHKHGDDGKYKHGDICPKCGNPNMRQEKENKRSFSCASCGHRIYAPTEEKLQRMRERRRPE